MWAYEVTITWREAENLHNLHQWAMENFVLLEDLHVNKTEKLEYVSGLKTIRDSKSSQ
jgi:hypothetical protein